MSPVVGEGFGPPLSFPILQNLRAGIQLSRCRIILDATAIAVKLCFREDAALILNCPMEWLFPYGVACRHKGDIPFNLKVI